MLMTPTNRADLVRPSRTAAPYVFGTVFWGGEHRDYFVRYCLPSMLATHNIPAVVGSPDTRFLICTTHEDWDALAGSPAMAALFRHMAVDFIELPADVIRQRTTMLAMSWGHREITSRAFDVKARGVVVCPDVVLSDGTLATLDARANGGAAVVVTPALRFRAETLLPALAASGSGPTIELSGRTLAALAIPHLHSETIGYKWETPYLSDPPISCIWDAPDGRGILVHTFSWAPLLIDYARLRSHDVSVFDHWTMDGDYIYANVGDSDAVRVVADSDDALMISFTRESARSAPLRRHWTAPLPAIARYRKGLILRRFMFSAAIDPLKRRLFRTPVRIHASEISSAWLRKESQVQNLLEAIVYPPTLTDRIATVFSSIHFTVSRLSQREATPGA